MKRTSVVLIVSGESSHVTSKINGQSQQTARQRSWRLVLLQFKNWLVQVRGFQRRANMSTLLLASKIIWLLVWHRWLWGKISLHRRAASPDSGNAQGVCGWIGETRHLPLCYDRVEVCGHEEADEVGSFCWQSLAHWMYQTGQDEDAIWLCFS